MSTLTIGIVDYGVGNHASVRHTLSGLGYRCRVSSDPAVLDACNLLVLPGVGAFRPAMEALKARSLDRYLIAQAEGGRALLGVCLGMQLLVQASHEDGFTPGLGLVPGEVVALCEPRWHIGWNTIEMLQVDPLFRDTSDQAFFFNHSYAYKGPIEYQVCRTVAGEPFTSVLRRGRVVGVQFHPEKSQRAGQALLRRLIEGLSSA